MGSNRTQKPTCLLAEPLVSDRFVVLHKKYYALAAEVAASSLPAPQAGRLVAFAVRSNAPRNRHSIRSDSESILPGTRFLSSRRNSAKLPDRRAGFASQKQGRNPLASSGQALGTPPSSSNPRLRLHLRQHLMHEVNRDRSFADGRRHALHIAGPDIPHGKHPRQAGLEKVRRARQRPRLLCQRRTVQIVAGEHESFVVERQTSLQPPSVRRGAGHHEQMAYVVADNLSAIAI